MRKQHLLKTMLLLCALIVGSSSVWAADEVYSTCLFGSKYNSKGVGDYTSTWSTTNGSFTWNIVNGNNNNNGWTSVKFGRKNNASTGKISTSTAYGVAITKVVLKIESLTASKINSAKLYTSSNNSSWTEAGSFAKATGSQTVTLNNPTADLYYKLEFDCASGSSNGLIEISKVEFYKSAAAPCETPTFSPVSGTQLSKNDVVTITSATASSTIYYTTDGSDPTTSSSHGAVGTASATVTVNDDMTIKAIAVKEGNSNSEVATAEYTIAKAANEITVTGGTELNIALTGADAVTTLDLGAITSATHGTPYFYMIEEDNVEYELDDLTGVITFTGTYKGRLVIVAHVDGTSDYEEAETEITINCSGDLRTPSFGFNDTETLAKNSTMSVSNYIGTDGEYTLESSDPTVASVDNDTKEISGVEVGSCTITVTTTEGTYYAAGSKSFTLNVINPKGTAENPYTVSEARDITIALGTDGTKDDVYVKGIVSKTGNLNSDGSITYFISDDGTRDFELQIYKGKGLDNAIFTSATDIQLEDVVTVFGQLKYYNGQTPEMNSGNYLTSFFRKSESNLTIVTGSPIELEMTTANPQPTKQLEWTTSSAGAMSFESSDNMVAFVSEEGVITAQGPGTATITISQATDDAYKASGNKPVTVNVTDNRDAVATAIDLTSAKTILKGENGTLAATSTKAAGFTGDIIYCYESADEDIFAISEGNFTGAGVGTTTVTITALPTNGNADYYKAATEDVAVTVNGTNSISLSPTTKEQALSNGAFEITATVPTENYDGEVTAQSSNTSVATVSVSDKKVTVTPVSVGEATITVTAGIGTYYLETAEAECAVKFTAPEGGTTMPSSEVTYTFDFTNNTNWGFPTDYTTGEHTYTYDGKTVTLNADTNGYKYTTNTSALLIGKNGSTLTLPAFDKPVTKISTEGVSSSSTKVTQNFYVGENAVSTGTTNATVDHEYNINENYQAAGTIYTLKVTNDNNTQIGRLTVHMYQEPTTTVTIPEGGMASYCSQYPLDLRTTGENWAAYYISKVEGTNVTFKKITGTIKGGQGFVLYGTPNTECQLTYTDSEDELSDNKMSGTLAPTYVNSTDDYYCLGINKKSGKFVKISGILPANKAYLKVDKSTVDAAGDAREFNFIFDDGEATGIADINRETLTNNGSFFNLNGQRVAQPTKGLYIVNGKKIVVK